MNILSRTILFLSMLLMLGGCKTTVDSEIQDISARDQLDQGFMINVRQAVDTLRKSSPDLPNLVCDLERSMQLGGLNGDMTGTYGWRFISLCYPDQTTLDETNKSLTQGWTADGKWGLYGINIVGVIDYTVMNNGQIRSFSFR